MPAERFCFNCKYMDSEGYCNLFACEVGTILACEYYDSDLDDVLDQIVPSGAGVAGILDEIDLAENQQQIDWESGDYVTYVHRVGPTEIMGTGLLGFVGSFKAGVNIAELKQNFGGGTYRIDVRGPAGPINEPFGRKLIYSSFVDISGEPLPTPDVPQAEKPQVSQEVLDKLMEFSEPVPQAPQAIMYNISDFPFEKVHVPSLAATIENSPLPEASIMVCNATCRIDFAATLSGVEMQLLNKIICAHPGDGSPGEPVNISGFVKQMPDGAIKYLPAGGGLYGGGLGSDHEHFATNAQPKPEEPPDQFSLVRSLVADGVFKKNHEDEK